jgi:hypothetical protein
MITSAVRLVVAPSSSGHTTSRTSRSPIRSSLTAKGREALLPWAAGSASKRSTWLRRRSGRWSSEAGRRPSRSAVATSKAPGTLPSASSSDWQRITHFVRELTTSGVGCFPYVITEFEVVLADGELVTANDKSNSDRMSSSSHLCSCPKVFILVFWALRGGGAGSWGVITSVTVKTYPTFNATLYSVTLALPSAELVSDVMTAHAQHVFDWEPTGHYYEIVTLPGEGTIIIFATYSPNASTEETIAQMNPFFDEVLALGLVVLSNTTTTALANEIVHEADDQVGSITLFGSRLVPSDAYKSTPEAIGKAHGELINSGFLYVGLCLPTPGLAR